MKKLFFFILFLFSCSYSFSQDEQEVSHLDFVGIPITGELDAFVSKLLKSGRGFKIEKANRSNDFDGFTSTTLKGGSFWKFKECTVHVRHHNELGFVSSVLVNYNVKKGEEDLYDEIILSYDKKYGEHIEPPKDGSKEYIWLLDNGRIRLACFKDASFIGIRYEDYPEALIETEKELKKLKFKGHAEDVDL